MSRIKTHKDSSEKKNNKSLPVKLLILLLVIIAATGLFIGCAKNAESSDAAQETTALPSPAKTPIATTQPDITPEPDPVQEEEDYMATIHEGWIYYLDVNDPVVIEYSEDPLLHKKLEDESEDVSLDIRGFNFNIIGDYIYIDSNDLDLDETGIQTWGTTRMNLDGSGRRKLEYGSMSARMIPEGEQKFYFTTLGDSAIYVSDFSCENVQTLTINLPDKADLDNKLGTANVLQLSITDIADGKITFDVTISAEDGTILYGGSYNTTIVGTSTEKLSGTYYEYGSQENE